MPEYVYRAVTKRGQIVRNKVESSNKSNLIKKLKSNDLLPIEVLQVSYASKKARGPKKNIMNIDEQLTQLIYFKVEKSLNIRLEKNLIYY